MSRLAVGVTSVSQRWQAEVTPSRSRIRSIFATLGYRVLDASHACSLYGGAYKLAKMLSSERFSLMLTASTESSWGCSLKRPLGCRNGCQSPNRSFTIASQT